MSDNEGYDGLVCVRPGCGGTWFRVESVRLDQDFGVIDHVGLPFCDRCGAVFIRLRESR